MTDARFHQVAAEAAYSVDPDMQLVQLAAEAAYSISPDLRLVQLAVEVVRPNSAEVSTESARRVVFVAT